MQPQVGLLRQPGTVLFGRGIRHALADVIPTIARRVLFVTDARMSEASELLELRELVESTGRHVEVIASAPAELPADAVVQAARDLSAAPDLLVAVGGGSVIDFAKVLAVLLSHGGAPADYYGEFRVPGGCIPVVAIPTTGGTGSEVTPIAVVSDSESGVKVGISSPYLIPLAAICDAELTDSAPASLTAAAGTDALSHCIEAFTAVTRYPAPTLVTERVFAGKSLFSDLYALDGIRAAGRALRNAVHGPSDATRTAAARDDMMFAGLAGGFALGSGGTAATHALQYPVGALSHTPHGAGIAALLPYVMEYNRPLRIAEFAQIAVALGADDGEDIDALSLQAVERVRTLLADIGMPATLADLGVPHGQSRWIAEQAFKARRLVENNPRALSIDDLTAIADAAYTGDTSIIPIYQKQEVTHEPEIQDRTHV